MDWDKWGLFISLVTPLLLGVGGWIVNAMSKRRSRNDSQSTVDLTVDYETDYINLLKRTLVEVRKENAELKRENKALRAKQSPEIER